MDNRGLDTKQIYIFMKGEVIMNFRKAKENTMKGIGKHSTLISFVIAAVGVGASIYFASKEVPKAKAEVKEILAKEDLTKQQKVVESAKAVGKNCWKTTVIALGTVLLVTGTSAITAANTAATVAGLTNTINIAEQKLKDYKESVDEIPNKKVKEEVQQSVTQKAINRATANLKEEDYVTEDCPDMYLWVDKWTGVKFKATYQMLGNAEKIIDNMVRLENYQTLFDFYEELVEQGAIFLDEAYPQMCDDHAFTHCINLTRDVCLNHEGKTVHYITYSEPTTDF
jgi:hypothetical protein